MGNMGDSFWVGLADIDDEGEFKWQTTTETVASTNFAAWGQNQPDGGEAENCVAAMNDHYYFW